MRVVNGVTIKNMDDVKLAASRSRFGYAWFDADSMDFWQTQLVTDVFAGRYFVTSDSTFDDKRAYSIREVTDLGQIDTISFQEHVTLDGVMSALDDLLGQ